MLKIGGQEIPSRTIFLVVSEGLLVLIGLVSAIAISAVRWGARWPQVRGYELAQFGLIVLVCEACLYYNDVYDLRFTRAPLAAFVHLMESFGFASLILALLYYAAPGLALRRGVAVIAGPLIMLMIIGWRWLLEAAGVFAWYPERMVVLGTGPIGITAVREICARPELNFNVVGFLDADPANVGKPLVNPGIVATLGDLEEVIRKQSVERVIVSLKETDKMPVPTLLRLKFAGIAVEDAGALLERVTGRVSVERPNWLILSEGFRQSSAVHFTKRAIDVVLSSVLLLASLPLMAAIAAAVAAESGFPVLFRQKRIGLGRQPFEMLKFRSMYQDAEARGPSWARDGDRRITRVGRIIRKYRLDELPQFWNVLRRDMSLVGPRPEQAYFCDLLEKEMPLFSLRHQVRPGITGWAQTKYGYGAGAEDAARKLEFDLFYIKHRSLLLDLVIMFETVKVMVFARGSK